VGRIERFSRHRPAHDARRESGTRAVRRRLGTLGGAGALSPRSAHFSRGQHRPRRNTRTSKQAEREDCDARNNPDRRKGCKGPMCCGERLGHGNSPKAPDPAQFEARFVPAAICALASVNHDVTRTSTDIPAKASVGPTKLPDTGIAWRMSRTTATGIRLNPPTLLLVGWPHVRVCRYHWPLVGVTEL
jgi:hypothetical protein